VTATLTLVTTVWLGRVLGPTAFGMFSWGIALLAYFSIFHNLGLNVVGVREAARDASRIPKLMGEILGLRAVASLLAFGLYLLILLLLDKPPLFKLVVAVQGLTLFAHAASVEWVYEGVQQMGVLARRHIVVAVLTLAGTLLLVREPDDVVLAAAATVAAAALGNGWILLTYRRQFGVPRLRGDLAAWKALLRPGLPIAVSLFMIQVYTSLDQLMLGLMRTEQEVGWYAAAYRLITAVLIPSSVLLQAFMPALSEAHGDPERMRARGRRFIAALLAVGFPLAVAGAFLAPLLIRLFGADYAPAAPALTILMVDVSLSYFHIGLGRALVAWDRERDYMAALVGGAVANVVLNLLLIPPYGIVGAAVATMLSEGAVLAVTAWLHYRVTATLYAGTVLRAATATAIGVGGAAALGGALSWPLAGTAVAMAVGYAAAAQALGVLDVATLLRLVRRPLS
jgi:PST family polysaccharide transporter